MSFLAAKGLMVIARAAYTLQCRTGVGVGRLTPHIPQDLSQRIACDMAYRDFKEPLIDLAAFGTSGALLGLGFNLPARLLGVFAVRRGLGELIPGPEPRFFLGLIPKEFLPIAAGAGAVSKDVVALVDSALSVADDVALILAGTPPATGNLVIDVVSFATRAAAVYERAWDVADTLSGESRDLIDRAGALALALPGAALDFVAGAAPIENRPALDELNHAIVTFGMDVGRGFAAVTNPFLALPAPVQPPPAELGTAERFFGIFFGVPPVAPPPEDLLARVRREAPRRGFVGIPDLRAIVQELKGGQAP